jgi:hypothetical protein
MPALRIDRVPLIVGVTGHRDLAPADEPPLRDALRALLDEIGRGMPHTQIAVLAVLRRGAGLLGAEVALDAGLDVIGCVAGTPETCARDLAEPDASRFRAVVRRCSRLAVVEPEDSDPGGATAAASHVAFHSHILIALWDGAMPRTLGATAAVVRLRETGIAPGPGEPGARGRHEPDPMPVFQIVTPHAGAARPSEPFSVQRRYPRRYSGDRRAQQDFDDALARFDRYNDDLAATGDLPENAGLPGLMVLTDRAANRLQRRSLLQVRTLYCISVAAIAAQLGFTGNLGPEPIKVATLAAAFVAYRVMRSADLENRYQDYRAVSEGLRVQTAWNAAGTGDEYVDPFYMRMQQSELQWIRMALRSSAFLESLAPRDRDERVALAWVREQWRYYHGAARRDQRRADAYRRLGKVSQVIGVVTMLLVAVLLIPSLHWLNDAIVLNAKHWATSFAALVAAAAALFGSYADKQGYSANAKRYDRMFGVFDRAMRQLHRRAGGGPGAEVRVMREVGHEALVEQAEWLLARRDRPLRAVGR